MKSIRHSVRQSAIFVGAFTCLAILPSAGAGGSGSVQTAANASLPASVRAAVGLDDTEQQVGEALFAALEGAAGPAAR